MEDTTYLLPKSEKTKCCDKCRRCFEYILMKWDGICIIIILILGVAMIVSGVIALCNYIVQPNYIHIYIMRKSDNTELTFTGIKRDVCLASYFDKFPLGRPQNSFEYIDNTVAGSITLKKLHNTFDIPIHWQGDFDMSKINTYNNTLFVWDYKKIPELARSMGCTQCKSWNINPISNIMDDSLYDVVWVLEWDKEALNKHVKLKTYYQNWNGTIFSLISSDKSNLDNYVCVNHSPYEFDIW